MQLEKSVLGKKVSYTETYDKSLLFPILRAEKREELGFKNPLPFQGYDLWRAFELSWLNEKGKPQVALAEFLFPASSPFLIESKSFKLYLNSYNQTPFSSPKEVQERLQRDLSDASKSEVEVRFIDVEKEAPFPPLKGTCIDDLDIETDIYNVTPSLLKQGSEHVEETLYTHLFKSNCLVTGQPDWATVLISYKGKALAKEALLQYLISYRCHLELHEQAIERIFRDLSQLKLEELTVIGFFTRRGGLDINPVRSTTAHPKELPRLLRQ